MSNTNWSCESCTFVNNKCMECCEICGTLHSTQVPVRASAPAPAPAPVRASAPVLASVKPEWVCKSCTFENNKFLPHCEMCGTLHSTQVPVRATAPVPVPTLDDFVLLCPRCDSYTCFPCEFCEEGGAKLNQKPDREEKHEPQNGPERLAVDVYSFTRQYKKEALDAIEHCESELRSFNDVITDDVRTSAFKLISGANHQFNMASENTDPKTAEYMFGLSKSLCKSAIEKIRPRKK